MSTTDAGSSTPSGLSLAVASLSVAAGDVRRQCSSGAVDRDAHRRRRGQLIAAILIAAAGMLASVGSGSVANARVRHVPFHRSKTRRASSSARAAARPPALTCANTATAPTTANIPVIEAATMCLINQQRQIAGVGLLSEDADLQAAADQHDAEMISLDYYSHDSPTGSTPYSRLLAVGYLKPNDCDRTGENLNAGTLSLATPAAIVASWMSDSRHRANILNPHFTQTGLAIVASVPTAVAVGEPGATYDQEFGTITAC